jgi:hypothetical protein
VTAWIETAGYLKEKRRGGCEGGEKEVRPKDNLYGILSFPWNFIESDAWQAPLDFVSPSTTVQIPLEVSISHTDMHYLICFDYSV